jgi:hypothetical protein
MSVRDVLPVGEVLTVRASIDSVERLRKETAIEPTA